MVIPLSLTLSVAVVYGLCIGSFLNVVVHRVPAGMSLNRPGSHCPRCEHPVRSFDNVPVVSWLVLRAKCRDCRAPISARYPLVELATGVAFGVVAWQVGLSPNLPLWLYLTAIGIALTLIDLDVKRLPDAIVLPSYAVVIALVAVAGYFSGDWPIVRAAASALVWAALFGLPWIITTGRAMGFGDVKFAPILGLALGWMGWSESLVGYMAGLILAVICAPIMMLAAGAGRRFRIPYGPFMIVGAFVGLFAGHDLGQAYLDWWNIA